MKKQLPLLALLLTLACAACGTPAGGGEPGGTPMERNPDYVNVTSPDAPAPLAEEPDHTHALSEEDHTVDHEPAGYCGNTMTTVSRETRLDGEPWEASFDGSDSVALTDLLLYLDYSGPVCRCLPEYNVDTEFGTGYGVNLTEGYVRHDGGQVDLTAEQAEEIRAILDRQGAN